MRVTALLLFLSACQGPALPFYRSAMLVPEWLSTREAAGPTMHRVGPFSSEDQYGTPVTERAFAGKATVVQFFFTRCRDVCPITTAQLRRVMGSFPGNSSVQVLSFSVSPEQDSVAELAGYALTRRIDDTRWHLLTGPPEALRRLARESFFVGLGDPATYGVQSLAHTESLVLVDGERRLRGVYAGTLPLEVDRLVQDIKALLAE